MARAYVIPIIVMGRLRMIRCITFVVPDYQGLASFPDEFQSDTKIFVADELAYVNKTMQGYNNALIVFFLSL